jgi:pimeloyl-ACP methyl ester carboxylesterase
VPFLHAAGFRTVVPYLRGFGDTSFLSKDTMRSGEIVAMAQDAIDLADALNLQKFAVVGHDWGARIAYALAIAVPQRISRIVTVSVGWQPGELPTPSLNYSIYATATASRRDNLRRSEKDLRGHLAKAERALLEFGEATFDV